MGLSGLSLLLASIVWVTVGAEAVVPLGAIVPVLTALNTELYAACQCLQASLTKDYNKTYTALILSCT